MNMMPRQSQECGKWRMSGRRKGREVRNVRMEGVKIARTKSHTRAERRLLMGKYGNIFFMPPRRCSCDQDVSFPGVWCETVCQMSGLQRPAPTRPAFRPQLPSLNASCRSWFVYLEMPLKVGRCIVELVSWRSVLPES